MQLALNSIVEFFLVPDSYADLANEKDRHTTVANLASKGNLLGWGIVLITVIGLLLTGFVNMGIELANGDRGKIPEACIGLSLGIAAGVAISIISSGVATIGKKILLWQLEEEEYNQTMPIQY